MCMEDITGQVAIAFLSLIVDYLLVDQYSAETVAVLNARHAASQTKQKVHGLTRLVETRQKTSTSTRTAKRRASYFRGRHSLRRV